MGQAVSDNTTIHPAISPEQLRRLYQVSKVIHSTLDQQEALDLIVREAVGLVNATSGSVVLINPIDGFLEIQAAHGLSAGTKLKLRVGEGITGWVARHGQPLRVGDVQADAVVEQIAEAFAANKNKPAPPLMIPGEPRQTAPREVIEEAPVQLGHMHYSWHVPDIRHADLPAQRFPVNHKSCFASRHQFSRFAASVIGIKHKPLW